MSFRYLLVNSSDLLVNLHYLLVNLAVLLVNSGFTREFALYS
ncbi:hypothetical protein P4576_18995 [Peribacillus frigoritolerans]|nr:hypothetical protein [Peribacillus frigoritolerans]